jgi:hypothetical protein
MRNRVSTEGIETNAELKSALSWLEKGIEDVGAALF